MAFKKSDIEKIIEEIRSDLDQARLSNRSSQELNLILVNRLKPYFASISSKEDAHQLFKKLSVFLHSDKLERFFGSDILTYLEQKKSKDLPFKALLAANSKDKISLDQEFSQILEINSETFARRASPLQYEMMFLSALNILLEIKPSLARKLLIFLSDYDVFKSSLLGKTIADFKAETKESFRQAEKTHEGLLHELFLRAPFAIKAPFLLHLKLAEYPWLIKQLFLTTYSSFHYLTNLVLFSLKIGQYLLGIPSYILSGLAHCLYLLIVGSTAYHQEKDAYQARLFAHYKQAYIDDLKFKIQREGISDEDLFLLEQAEYLSKHPDPSCGLLSVSHLIRLEELKNMPIDSEFAYIFTQENLYYKNKKENSIQKIEIKPEIITQLKHKLRPQDKERRLEQPEINKISLATGHLHFNRAAATKKYGEEAGLDNFIKDFIDKPAMKIIPSMPSHIYLKTLAITLARDLSRTWSQKNIIIWTLRASLSVSALVLACLGRISIDALTWVARSVSTLVKIMDALVLAILATPKYLVDSLRSKQPFNFKHEPRFFSSKSNPVSSQPKQAAKILSLI